MEAKQLSIGERRWYLKELTAFYEEQNSKTPGADKAPMPDELRKKLIEQNEMVDSARSAQETRPKT